RALGFAGYGSVEGIASADEVVVAQQRSDGPTAKQIAALTKLWQLYVKEMGGQGAIQEAHEASVIDQRIGVLLKPSLGGTGVVLSLAGATKAQVSEAIDTLKEMAAEESVPEDIPFE
ncbi:hypothetical protein LCGC14_2674370, partial [marine sediment metagenome]